MGNKMGRLVTNRERGCKADRDMYEDGDMVIKPVDQESMREIEFITLEQEVKDGVQENRRRLNPRNP